jgi:hypothetical protein
MILGAEVMNTTPKFVKARVEIEVETEGEPLVFSEEKVVGMRVTTDVNFTISAEELEALGLKDEHDYKVTTRVYLEDKLADEIVGTFMMETPMPVADKAEFVSVKDDYFVIGDKPWYLAGINYWSTWNPALEKQYYWLGQFDRQNYSQKNVEADLEYAERVGINAFLIRVDFIDIDRSVHGIRDFLIRCKRHNIRLMLSFVKATASKFYSKIAVEDIFGKVFISENPTVFAIDMEWETEDDHIHFPNIQGEFDDEWQAWLERKYGSVEKAEEYYGVKMERGLYGYVKYPEFTNKTAPDIRLFSVDCINEYWSRLIPHIKPYLPNQLITFRHGGMCTNGPAQAAEYIDFTPLETYGLGRFEEDIYNPENEIGAVGFITAGIAAQKYETGGKPVIYAEYGQSVCGIKWLRGVIYDHENRQYYPEKIKFQTTFNRYMCEAIEEGHCAGSSPWWWCGGFRYTELADFGYMMPDGQFNESGREYIEFCKKMKAKAGMPDTREEYVCVTNPFKYNNLGKFEAARTDGVPAFGIAHKEGKKLVVKTEYKVVSEDEAK